MVQEKLQLCIYNSFFSVGGILAPYNLPAGLLNTAESRGEGRRRLLFLLVLDQSKFAISSFHSNELGGISASHHLSG